MLRDCYRILTPGGRLRIATPNLLKFLEVFRQEQPSEVQHFIQRKLKSTGWPHTASPECMILNMQMRDWGHLFVYDPRSLRELFERVGFRNIQQFASGESDDPNLRNLESRQNTSDRDVDTYETMVFQAVRP